MVDTLLHHYQRLWRAEATPEILSTRKLPKKGLVRSFNSLNNIFHSPYLPKPVPKYSKVRYQLLVMIACS